MYEQILFDIFAAVCAYVSNNAAAKAACGVTLALATRRKSVRELGRVVAVAACVGNDLALVLALRPASLGRRSAMRMVAVWRRVGSGGSEWQGDI